MKHKIIKLFSFFAIAGAIGVASMVISTPHSNADADKVTISKEALGDHIRSYLIDNPDVVVAALAEFERIEKEKEQEAFKDKLSDYKATIDETNFPTVAGNPDGDVTVIEFFDYNCGYCKRGFNEVQTLIEADPNVKIVFQEYPILGPSSLLAGQYALAATQQDKYFEFHAALMNHSGSKSEAILTKIAEDLGLDVAKLKEDAASEAVQEELDRLAAVARDFGIRGTPAFIVGDYLAPGYMSAEQMEQIIANARKAK